MIIKSGELYQFKNDESAVIFTCDSYCKQQGQGHTHIFTSKDRIDNSNVRIIRVTSAYSTTYTYECKCLYFWDNILNFKADFSPEDIKQFGLCGWKCGNKIHQKNKEKICCICPLWHSEDYKDKNKIEYRWEYKGHLFNCIHDTVYTIFLVDRSGSMESKSAQPSDIDIKNKLDNMLGCTVEAIINYCRKRHAINHNDICSLIGYDNYAKEIFKDYRVGEFNKIKNKCLSLLTPGGATRFKIAFENAAKLLEDYRKNGNGNYNPIIILLTDGLDHDFNATFKYLRENVSKYYIFIILNIYKIVNEI